MKRQDRKRLDYWFNLIRKEDDKFKPLYAKYIQNHRSLLIEDREDVMQHGIEMIVLVGLLEDELNQIQRERPFWKKLLDRL